LTKERVRSIVEEEGMHGHTQFQDGWDGCAPWASSLAGAKEGMKSLEFVRAPPSTKIDGTFTLLAPWVSHRYLHGGVGEAVDASSVVLDVS
jgi:hypothetical protein